MLWYLTISCKRTLPSFVSFMSPAPDTSLQKQLQHTHTPVAGCLSYFAKPHSCVRVWLHKTRLFPPTHIFMVPLGPRLVFRTSCRPLAAEMFTCSAWAALATSAFGLSDLTADMSKGTRGFYACALENWACVRHLECSAANRGQRKVQRFTWLLRHIRCN